MMNVVERESSRTRKGGMVERAVVSLRVVEAGLIKKMSRALE